MNNLLFLSLFLLVSAPGRSLAQAPAAVPVPVKIDFQDLPLGDVPDSLVITDAEAKFSITAAGDNRMLEMSPSPLVDGGVLVGPSVKGSATIRARVLATGKRRIHPRFGVGLHGVGGYRCLVVPARKELQFVKDEVVVAQVPFEWKSGTWTVVEFEISAGAGGGSLLEARAWEEGQPKPEAPQLTLPVETSPAEGKASLWAAPYAELSIAFDDILITAKP